jgi:hypothetical protein
MPYAILLVCMAFYLNVHIKGLRHELDVAFRHGRHKAIVGAVAKDAQSHDFGKTVQQIRTVSAAAEARETVIGGVAVLVFVKDRLYFLFECFGPQVALRSVGCTQLANAVLVEGQAWIAQRKDATLAATTLSFHLRYSADSI